MTRPILRLLTPLAALALGASAASVTAQEPATPPPPAPTPTTPAPTPAGSNPCLRPELGLLCPDLVMRRPYGLRLRRMTGGRALLASTNAIVNIGRGPLEIRGRRIGPARMAARQVLRAAGGASPRVLPESGRIAFFDTRLRGVYWKFEDAAAFELWALDGNGYRTRLVRTGPKVYYCFRDLTRVRSRDTGLLYGGSPRTEWFGACSQTGRRIAVTLGTSVGWADIYPWRYPQNWIDVTGLAGCFAYVHRADPAERLVELRDDNNSAAVSVRLPWRGTGGARGCPEVRSGQPPRGPADPQPTASGVQPEDPYG